ncbi:hypothetical protein [Streptomyces sp. NBC_00892]|uniref:hypothetical protein n=1 Tax=Streptomyces sp. NBC_00892 TaxID=2975861 RepID=UPI002251C07B|nr:hypothetical protein [Streptomyces sp. NBC_00892]MCX4902503.1 hypothetical protein [Streptomyces sp. NBC_00892]
MTPPRDAGSESGGRFRTVGQCRTRRDTGKRIAAESAAVAVAGPAAGLLPLPDFALTSAATWALNAMFFWWGEPACDLAAARVCGRAAVADIGREDLERERARSVLPRIWVTVRGLRTRPPLRLRLLCAEYAPLPDARGQAVHPLHTPAAS